MKNETQRMINEGRDIENKTIPKQIESACLEALSHYPELDKKKIVFRFQRTAGSTMFAQPLPNFLMKSVASRGYIIKISNNLDLEDGIRIVDMPHNVLVGWIGHELGHVMDYEQRSNWQLIKFGIGYVFSARYRIGSEKVADLFAIEHGLGEFILETKNYILDHSTISEDYKDKIKNIYLSPEETLAMIERMDPS